MRIEKKIYAKVFLYGLTNLDIDGEMTYSLVSLNTHGM